MAPLADRLKTSYAESFKIEPFFTGGRVQVASSGRWLLCQCGDAVHVVDAQLGRSVRGLVQPDDEFIAFAVAPDQMTLVSSHKSGLLRHWTWNDGEVVRTWKSLHSTPVVELAFDPTSTLVATGGTDGSLKVWDVRRQYCTHNLKGGSGVCGVVRFHPDDAGRHRVYGAFSDGRIRVWHLDTSTLAATLEGHFSAVTGLVFFPELDQAVSCGRDKVLILWDLKSNTSLRVVPTFEGLEGVVALALERPLERLNVAGGRAPHVLAAGERGVFRVWNMATATEVYTQNAADSLVTLPDLEGAAAITQLEHSHAAGEDLVYVVTFDHNIIVHQLQDGMGLVKQYAGFNDDILDVAWYGQDQTHLAVATNSRHVKVYEVATMNCTLLKGHTDLVLALATSKVDPNILVTSSKDNSVRVWRMTTSPFGIACVAVGRAHTASVGAVALSSAQLSFLVSGSQDTCLKVWRLNVAADAAAPATLSVACTAVAHDKDINAVAVAPNDKFIATGSQDKTAKIWDSSDLRLLGVLRGHRRGVWAVAFSPSDQVIATASTDATIRLWSLTDRSCIKTLEGHEASILRLQFVARGQQIISAASDGLLKLWTLKSGECAATLDGHRGKVWALAVGGVDDGRLVSGAGDATLVVWRDVTQEERKEKIEEQQRRLVDEQQLANLLHQGRVLDALELAVRLDQPFRTLTLLKTLMDSAEEQPELLQQLQQRVVAMATDHQDALLRYAATWNTNGRHCHQAQLVLALLVTQLTPDQLLALPSMRQSLAGLQMYGRRHMQRLDRLRQSTAILAYTAAKIQATTAMETD